MVKDNPIGEARRYMGNARQLLSEKAGKQGDLYSDPKYIKMAGNTAWGGVLIALDAALFVRENLRKNQRLDIKDYRDAAAKIDKNLNKRIIVAYDLLHKTLGYDGNLNFNVVQESLKSGEFIINWCEKKIPKLKS
jgi:hypothetical protein